MRWIRYIRRILKKYRRPLLLLSMVGLIWFYFCLPDPLFSDPYSTVLNDDQQRLIGAKISADGQWRFPLIDTVPEVFEEAIVAFEDSRFRYHLGIDPISIVRATIQNVEAGQIESGASTLSMQVIRLARKGKKRTIGQKIIEMFLAVRLELRYSKDEILRMYTSHAPFGGNVVGLEAASWRYFHKPAGLLSTAEGAMMAVLPNSPSLIHLGKNRNRLMDKRNRLLKRMQVAKIIDNDEYELSILESIPDQPYALPALAPHLLEYVNKKAPQQIVNSTVQSSTQVMVSEIAGQHHAVNVQSDIHNIGILILDTQSGEVLAYQGNAPSATQERAVDMIQARRSSGSVLKPLLYAHQVDEGQLMPQALVQDIPTQIRGFSPKNYNRKYTGATPADEALAMSLNIPAVINLQKYGVPGFLTRLQEHGISTLGKSADHYGLSLILGGGEVNLWQLCGAYANMGRTLRDFHKNEGKYAVDFYPGPTFTKREKSNNPTSQQPPLLSAGAIYQTFQAMSKVIRPSSEGQWQQFDSSQPIAWKTGTSYGHRDAWAVGISPRYTVGVWVGNADGEPKSGLVGVSKAGPVLFDVFNRLPSSPFFAEPIDDLVPTLACRRSGFLASQHCDVVDTIYSVTTSQRTAACPYHRLVHLDDDGRQVTSQCISPSEMKHTAWFELPPSAAFYYRQNHPDYRMAPPFRSDCLAEADKEVLSFLYPTSTSKIYLPKNRDGQSEQAVFRASHQNPKATLYWHLDGQYLGYTTEFHNMEISAEAGTHAVTVVDQNGNTTAQKFEIVE